MVNDGAVFDIQSLSLVAFRSDILVGPFFHDESYRFHSLYFPYLMTIN